MSSVRSLAYLAQAYKVKSSTPPAWDSIKDQGLWKGEILARHKNGEINPKYLHITAVKNAEGIVTNYVTTHTNIPLSKAASDEIERLAFYDQLTKLPNRRLFLDRLVSVDCSHVA